MKGLIVASAVLIASAGSALEQDLAAGENSFKKCLPCTRRRGRQEQGRPRA